jgi:hypothetical protein
VLAGAVYGGQAVPAREIGEPSSMSEKHGVNVDEERVRPRLGHRPEGGLELLGRSRADDPQLDPERPRRLLDDPDRWGPGRGRVGRIPEERDPPRARDRLLEQLELLELLGEDLPGGGQREPSHVSARAGEARNESLGK